MNNTNTYLKLKTKRDNQRFSIDERSFPAIADYGRPEQYIRKQRQRYAFLALIIFLVIYGIYGILRML